MAVGTTYPVEQLRYEPTTLREALANRGPRKGAIALMNVIVFMLHKLGATNMGIYNFRTVRFGSSLSNHAAGRAIDVGVPNANVDPGLGNWIFMRAIAVAVQCGICEIIWNNMRWTPQGGVQFYPHDNHDDHVHMTLTKAMADNASSIEELQRWFKAFFFYDFA